MQLVWLTADPLTHIATCYHAEFGRSVLKDVGINIREPPNWWVLEIHSLGMRGVNGPNIQARPLHVLPRPKKCCSAINGIRGNRNKSPKSGSARTRPLRVKRAWPPKTRSLWVALWSTRWRGPSSISVPNLKRIALLVQQLYGVPKFRNWVTWPSPRPLRVDLYSVRRS